MPELRVSSFYEIVEVGERLMLASQGAGIWQFEDERFSLLTDDQPTASVRCLAHDSAGRLWAGLADRGAVRIEGGSLLPAPYPALTGVTVRDIVETRDGALWFATEGAGLTRLAQGHYETFTTASGLVANSLSTLAPAADGGLWIGGHAGLGRFHDGEFTVIPELDGVEIFSVAEDDYGSVWIASEQGLYRRLDESGRVERLAEHRGRSLRSINGLAFDHEGGVWVSSYTSGLFQLREGAVANLTRANGLATDRVNSVYPRRDGSLLVGGDLGAVQVIDPEGGLSRLELRQPLPEVRIRGFLEDSAGALWISSYAGVLRVRDGEETLFTVADGLPTDHARFVYEDRMQRLWIGTRGGGLVGFSEDGFAALRRRDGLASDFVLSLAEDPPGNLLVGTQSGLSVLDPQGGITNYTAADGLPGELVFGIHVDQAGSAWLATTGGIARFANGRIDSATVREGLPAESIYDYAEDDRGRVWLTSSEGVIRLAKGQLEELFAGRRTRLDARLFDDADGMNDRQCTGGAQLARAADGSLWIPTLNGLSHIDPGRIRTNPIPPPVRVRRVLVDGRLVPASDAAGAPVRARAGARRYEFWFSALSFQAPAQVEVRYMLEGFDDDWLPAGQHRRALYTHLPPGEFVFRVIAANQDGLWNLEGASFSLIVEPRFHQRPVFFVLLALVLVAGPWGIFRWRLRIVQARSARLERLLSAQERLERERIRLIGELESRNEQLEDLTHAVSHDLKSPLFTIQGFLGALEKDIHAADTARVDKDLERIREAASYMDRLLEQLSKVRRLERADARFEEVDFARLAREVLTAVSGRIKNRRIEATVDSRMPAVVGDRLRLTELLQNLIDNAARFMGDQPRPRIEIGCRRDTDEPVFFVQDNGIGIAPRHQEQVFNLFQRLDHHHEGTGVGLTIVKRVVEAHHGRVWVESAGPGRGSTFCFTLPARLP